MDKRDFYLSLGIPEYWMIDPDDRTIRVARPGDADVTVSDRLMWKPRAASQPLVIDLPDLFARALG